MKLLNILENDRQERIIRAMEKALGIYDEPFLDFKKGETVTIRKMSLPRKDWNGVVTKVTNKVITVRYDKGILNFDRKSLESKGTKRGFEFKLIKS